MGSGRRRFFGAFFVLLGGVLLSPAISFAGSLAQGGSTRDVTPVFLVVLAISAIGGLAAAVGGLLWLFGVK
jgi:hypothetical protein